jgi:hypothetical protein
MSAVTQLPAVARGADPYVIAERVNELIKDYNSGRVEDLAQALIDIAALQADTRTLQVVSTQTGALATGTTLFPYDDTIPQNTEGDQYMSLSITPKSATSRLVIEVTGVFASSAGAAGNPLMVALFQDSTAGALAAVVHRMVTANCEATISFNHTMTSGTTSATTFRVRAGSNNAGTTFFNGNTGPARLMGGVMASSIVITEIL